MHIELICMGSVRRSYLKEGMTDYLRRLRRYGSFSVVEVPEVYMPPGAGPAEADAVKSREGGEIQRRLRPNTFTVALDERGQTLTSLELAGWLEQTAARGVSRLAFIIGSARGLDPALKERADYRLSLSRLTFPHEFARLLLLEQLYRASKINRGEPYHY